MNRSMIRSLTLAALTLPFALMVAVPAASESLLSASGSAAIVEDEVDFATQIWPMLEASCVECHGAKESFSNLRLDSAEGITKGGDLGKVLVAGQPDDSPLYVRSSLPQDDLDFMPVEGDPLTEEQVETLRTWIEQGADFGGWTGE